MTSKEPAIPAQLESKIEIADGLAIFRFELSRDFCFKPGQYATLWLTHRGKTIPRPYSVTSPPSQRRRLEFFINLVSEGILTPSLWDPEVIRGLTNNAPETQASVTGPKGRFVLDPEDPRDLVFVSSGTGIAPFMSMIRSLNEEYFNRPDDFPPRRIYLINGVRNSAHLGYRVELNQLALETRQNPGRKLRILYLPTVSRPEGDPAWKGLTGRAESLFEDRAKEPGAACELDEAVRELLRILMQPLTHVVYVCGHPGTVESTVMLLSQRGFKPDSDIKREKYYH